MKCILSGGNARIFAKAVQSLSKFATDLYLEADRNGLQLRSVNSNKSAVGTFRFYSSFFEDYDLSEVSTEAENYCRLSMKTCLGVFKSMKRVERCFINIDIERSKFIAKMNCRFETVKNFIISIIDDDNISADVPMDDAPNSICGAPKIFSQIIGYFQSSEEELTLDAEQDGQLIVRNYVQGSRVNDKFIRSQLKMRSSEFEEYKVAKGTSITFCLREFKAFIMFGEAVSENMKVMFHDAGSPAMLKIIKCNFFEATLLMSTLSPDDVTMFEDQLENESRKEQSLKTAEKRASTNIVPAGKSKRLKNSNNTRCSRRIESSCSDNSDDNELDAESIDLLRNYDDELESDAMPRIPNISAMPTELDTESQPHSSSEVFVTFVETEENEDEQIPQSPGNKTTNGRLRSIFSRCFEVTYVPREPSPSSQIFVPDSDEEN